LASELRVAEDSVASSWSLSVTGGGGAGRGAGGGVWMEDTLDILVSDYRFSRLKTSCSNALNS
jgi:hypothetical protein